MVDVTVSRFFLFWVRSQIMPSKQKSDFAMKADNKTIGMKVPSEILTAKYMWKTFNGDFINIKFCIQMPTCIFYNEFRVSATKVDIGDIDKVA